MAVVDTSAWIDYFEGGEKGREVMEALQEEECYTPAIVLAELSDNFRRKEVISDHSWKEFEAFVAANSEVVPMNSRIAVLAGEIKAERRKRQPDFSLADGIVAATAEVRDEEILTSDTHLDEEG